MCTMPTGTRSANARPLTTSVVRMASERPESLSAASRAASSMSLKATMGAMGPKISSWYARASGVARRRVPSVGRRVGRSCPRSGFEHQRRRCRSLLRELCLVRPRQSAVRTQHHRPPRGFRREGSPPVRRVALPTARRGRPRQGDGLRPCTPDPRCGRAEATGPNGLLKVGILKHH